MVVPNRPWERRADEGDAPWTAFEVYRELGPSRSLKAVADRVGRAINTIKIHSAKYHWAERAVAWDAEIARHQDKATLSEVERLQRLHVTQVGTVREVYFNRIKDAKKKELAVKTAVMGFEGAVKLERLVVGEATERTEHQLDLDLTSLDEEEASMLIKLLVKIGAISSGDDESTE